MNCSRFFFPDGVSWTAFASPAANRRYTQSCPIWFAVSGRWVFLLSWTATGPSLKCLSISCAKSCSIMWRYPSKRTEQKSTSCCRIEATTGGAVMPRRYTKVEALSEEVFRRKAAGETNRAIGAHFGLSKAQIKGLISRQNRKQRLIANGIYSATEGTAAQRSLSEEQNGTTNGANCGCRWSCCEIFCPKLGEGEAEISGNRAFSREISDRNDVPFAIIGTPPQTVSALPTSCSQVSESVAACVCLTLT